MYEKMMDVGKSVYISRIYSVSSLTRVDSIYIVLYSRLLNSIIYAYIWNIIFVVCISAICLHLSYMKQKDGDVLNSYCCFMVGSV